MVKEKVFNTIKKHNMLDKKESVVVGLSGGADSVCLLKVLKELEDTLEIKVYAAHINHLIRGEEAFKDAEFTKKLCERLNIELFCSMMDIPKISKETHEGEEECGRRIRYEFFEEISKKLGGAKIATAHNQNDNAETVLFRLARGTSLKGLCGIPYVRGNIIRPLLDVPREEIEKYLEENRETYCTDSTNLNDIYARNKIRHNVLPNLCDISSGATEHIASLSEIISDDEAYLEREARKKREEIQKNGKLDIEKFLKLDNSIKRRILTDILCECEEKNITKKKIDDILSIISKNKTGTRVNFGKKTGYIAYSSLSFENKAEKSEVYVNIGETKGFFNYEITVKKVDTPPKKADNYIGVFDSEKISLPVLVRQKKNGDVIEQKGIFGKKKLSDLFIDRKINKTIREKIPVIVSNDKIIMVVSCAKSRLFTVDENTKEYITIECRQKNPEEN